MKIPHVFYLTIIHLLRSVLKVNLFKKKGQGKDEMQLSLLYNAIRQLFIFTLGWN